MTHETVTLRLPRQMLSQAQLIASQRRTTIGEMIRQFLEVEVAQPDLLGPLNKDDLAVTLAPVFLAAHSWSALAHQLQVRGMELRPMGTGLAIYWTATGAHLFNTASVGYRYRKLVKRYGAPMPGHAHGAQWLSGVTPQGDTAQPSTLQ